MGAAYLRKRVSNGIAQFALTFSLERQHVPGYNPVMNIEQRLLELGLKLPPTHPPVGLYAPAVISGAHLYLSGAGGTPLGNIFGRVGRDLTLEQGREAARTAVLNALGNANALLGRLDRITRIVKLLGFVSSAEDFYRQPEVIDGASALLLDLFGPEKGAHARSAIGVFCLPFNLPVEIEMILELKP